MNPTSAARTRAGVGMTSQRTRRRLVRRLRERGIAHAAVLAAIENTPRHLFLDEALAHQAYDDTPLPIGRNQTISQPFVVARMTELALGGGLPVKKILEIGTGCGYQTAILSQLVDWVFTVERIDALHRAAKTLLPELGYRNVSYFNADGYQGWPSNQPFDAILVTAAPAATPPELLAQLAVGGRLVIPVGGRDLQHLRIFTRRAGGFDEQTLDAVRFVPMLDGRAR